MAGGLSPNQLRELLQEYGSYEAAIAPPAGCQIAWARALVAQGKEA